MSKEELLELLKKEFCSYNTEPGVNEIDLSGIDFGDYSFKMNKCKTKGRLEFSNNHADVQIIQKSHTCGGSILQDYHTSEDYIDQSGHICKGSIVQKEHDVDLSIFQYDHAVGGSINQSQNKAGGDIFQTQNVADGIVYNDNNDTYKFEFEACNKTLTNKDKLGVLKKLFGNSNGDIVIEDIDFGSSSLKVLSCSSQKDMHFDDNHIGRDLHICNNTIGKDLYKYDHVVSGDIYTREEDSEQVEFIKL